MILLELHLKNIASLESADIDFRNSLCEPGTSIPSPIFLISGDTGAGKTAILDAISLALYKKTPRISSVANVSKNEFKDSEGNSVRVNSIEQYTRMGIAEKDESFTEVVFEGNDGIVYRAKLRLGRTRGNTDKRTGKRPLKYKKPEWTVKAGNNDWTKDNVEATILQAVGLSFEQFGRMAMLAQGQFASFLTGDRKERESILEQLTNTSHFTKYGQAVKNLFDKAKADRDGSKKEYDTIHSLTLTGEEVEQLTERKISLTRQKTVTEKVLKETDTILKLLEQLERDKKAREGILDEIKEVVRTLSSQEYIDKQRFVALWDKTVLQREWLSELSKNKDVKAEAIATKIKLGQRFEALTADLKSREATLESRLATLRTDEEWLRSQEGFVNLYADCAALMVRLKIYEDELKKLKANETAIKKLDDDSVGLRKAEEEAKIKADLAAKKVLRKSEELIAQREEYDRLNPSKINKDIDEANKRIAALDAVCLKYQRIEQEQTALANLRKEISEGEGQLASFRTMLAEAETEMNQATVAWETVSNCLTTMKAGVDDMMVALRSRMKVENTEVCPLCGSHIVNLPDDDHFKSIILPLEEEKEKCKSELERKSARYKSLNDTLQKKSGEIDSKRKQLKRDSDTLTKLETELRQAVNSLQLSSDSDLSRAIEIDKTSQKQLLDNLQTRRGKAEEVQKKITRIFEEKQQLDKLSSNASSNLVDALNKVDNNRRDKERLTKESEQVGESSAHHRVELDRILRGRYPSWAEDTASCATALKKDTLTYNQRKESYDSRIAQAKTDGQEIDTLTKIQGEILTMVSREWECTPSPLPLTTTPGRKIDIAAEWRTLHSRTLHQRETLKGAEKNIAELTAKLQNYYTDSSTSEETLRDIEQRKNELEGIRRHITEVESLARSRRDALSSIDKSIEETTRQLSLGDGHIIPEKEEVVSKDNGLRDQLSLLMVEIGQIEGRLNTNNSNLKQLEEARKKLESSQANFNKWELLNSYFGGTRLRTLVQTYILRPLLANANIYLSRITDRYTLTCSEDNEQLAILVLDRYNKNKVRSVTVLSGGERFMVSLALSLALSSLNRPDMNINILFIDEGFGTLDERSLDSVMATLERLCEIAGQGNRRVGVISHRDELYERIPTKIMVEKHGEGRSCVVVPKSQISTKDKNE